MNGIKMSTGTQPKYGICVQEIFEVYFPSTKHTIEFIVSSKPQTFQEAQQWCPSLGTNDQPYEIITPFGDEEEDYFLNFAENLWIGLGDKSPEINKFYELYPLNDQNLA